MNHYPAYAKGRLDPQADALLTRIALEKPASASRLTPDDARGSFLPPAWLGTPREMDAVRDVAVPGPAGTLRLRTYAPAGPAPLPVLVFFHGGGFVAGSLDEFDDVCTRLADGAACLVVSVDYRRAPEAKYPAAVEDATAALRWIGAHVEELGGDPGRIAVAGDSAGGNLAAVSTLVARDEGGPSLVRQVLISPWVDLSDTATESFRAFGDGSWLSTESIAWYRGHYLSDPAEALLPTASPLLARDLRGLPSALVLNAEFDVLRDQVEAYAGRLRSSGNAVEHRLYAGMLHDFVVLPALFDRAAEAIDGICADLRTAFRPAPPGRRPARR